MNLEIPMDPAAVRALVNHAKEVSDLNTEANALMVKFIAEQKRLEAEITDLRETNAALRELLRDKFACAALTGLLAGVPANLNWSAERAKAMGLSLPAYYADAAFTYADAMMVRRAQQTGAPALASEPWNQP